MSFLEIKYLLQRPYLKRVLANVSWLFVDRILRMVIGLLVSVLLARHLGPDKFGLFSYAMALVAIGSAIAGLGLDGVVVKELLLYPDERDQLLGTSAILQFIGGMLIFFILVSLMHYFHADHPELVSITCILGPLNFLKASEVVKYWFESQLLSKVTVRLENGVYIIFACIKAILLYYGFGLTSIVVVVLVESVVVAIILIVIYQLKGGVLSVGMFSKSQAVDLLRKSWPFVISSIAVMVYLRIDVIMLERYLGNTVVGNYGIATRLAEVWYFIPGVIVASVFPSIVDAKTKDEKLYSTRFIKLLSFLFWISFGIALTTSLASKWLISICFGPQYSIASSILSIITWSSVFVFVGVASGRWYLIENLQKLLLYRTVIGAFINVSLNLVLIPRYGAIGAAWATLASQAYANVFSNLVSRKTRSLFYLQVRALIYPISKMWAGKT